MNAARFANIVAQQILVIHYSSGIGVNRMRDFIVAYALLVAATTAIAAPAYLKCTASSNVETEGFAVALDEQNRKITHTDKSGTAYNSEGLFTVDKIAYQSVEFFGSVSVTRKYEIDRTDLSVASTACVEPVDPSPGSKKRDCIAFLGKCEIVKTPKRKI